MTDRVREQVLRDAAARELNSSARHNEAEASAVLADFYEHDGQLSRATLWREHERLLKLGSDRSSPPDLLAKRRQNPLSPVDPRRNAMIWLLHGVWRDDGGMEALHAINMVHLAFKLSWQTIRNIVKQRDFVVRDSTIEECNHPTMRATQRLIEAGALPRWIDPDRANEDVMVELPPDTWPITDNDVRRRLRMGGSSGRFPQVLDQMVHKRLVK